MKASEGEIRNLRRRWSSRLLDYPGVVGVGVERDDDGEFHLIVFLESDHARVGLPLRIEGQMVRYRVSGAISEQLVS